jgi:hypothetical protein
LTDFTAYDWIGIVIMIGLPIVGVVMICWPQKDEDERRS